MRRDGTGLRRGGLTRELGKERVAEDLVICQVFLRQKRNCVFCFAKVAVPVLQMLLSCREITGLQKGPCKMSPAPHVLKLPKLISILNSPPLRGSQQPLSDRAMHAVACLPAMHVPEGAQFLQITLSSPALLWVVSSSPGPGRRCLGSYARCPPSLVEQQTFLHSLLPWLCFLAPHPARKEPTEFGYMPTNVH